MTSPYRSPFTRFARFLAAAVFAIGLSGCATFSTDPEVQAEFAETRDPFESFNRQVFAFNLALDTFILEPVAFAYREVVPEPGREVVRNFINHLRLPFTIMNDLAQGEPERAGQAFSRFLVNTTLGLGGLFDAARGMEGLEYHSEDAGQTLAVYGVEDGPYLMLPFLGPSNVRDALGLAVGWFTDPVSVAVRSSGEDYLSYARGGTDAVDARSRNIELIDNLQRRSLDFYATVRSLYRQRRDNEIRNGESGSLDIRPGIAASPDEEMEEPPDLLARGEPQLLRREASAASAAGGLTTAENVRTFDEAARSYERAMRAFDEAVRTAETETARARE